MTAMTEMNAPRLPLDVGCVSSAPEHAAVPPFAPALVPALALALAPASAPAAVPRVMMILTLMILTLMILTSMVLARRWPVYSLRCVHVAADLPARSAW